MKILRSILESRTIRYVTHNERPGIDVSSATRVGVLDTPFSELKEKFGEPIYDANSESTTAEWRVVLLDRNERTVAIYDWETGLDPKKNRRWIVATATPVLRMDSTLWVFDEIKAILSGSGVKG